MTRTKRLLLMATIVLLDPRALWSQTAQWPIRVPRITQDYACHNCTSPDLRGFHAGIDITHALISCSTGAVPVYPILSGKVVRTVRGCAEEGDSACGRSFGNHVLIEHRAPGNPGGPLYSLYAHLRSVTVTVGDTLGTGTSVGVMGKTGAVDACHVHLGLTDFLPPHLGAWVYPSQPLPSMGLFGYLDASYPAIDCDKSNQGRGCPDPKDLLLGLSTVKPSGTRNVLERPGSTGECVTKIEGGQAYMTFASHVHQGQEWQFIMLPSDAGPSEDPYGNGTCTMHATYGWLAEDTSPPLTGLAVQVMGQALAGVGLPVRQQPLSSSSELSKVWGGQLFWSTSTSPSGNGCSKPWYQISVPPLRANGATIGWICGDFLEFRGGQCVSSSIGSSLVREKACEATPEIPEVSTQAATSVTQQSASLNLFVNCNKMNTFVWFDWGTSMSLGQETVPRRNVGAGTSTIPISIPLSPLSCDTTYFFRARAQNSVGNAAPGQILSFRTDACGGGGGTETQELVTNGGFENGNTPWITNSSFHINAQPCPDSGSRYAFLAFENGTRGDSLFGTLDQVISIPATASAVDLSFRYSITTDDPSSEPKDVMSVWIYNSSGSSPLRFLETYSNRDAQNGCGPSFYERDSFSLLDFKGQTIRVRFLGTTDTRVGTPTVFRVDNVSVLAATPQASAPDVTTGNADQVSTSTARLNMTVDPNSDNTTVWFDLEAGDTSPNDDTEHIAVGADSQPKSVSISVFGLQCATLYHYRAQASNSQGPDSGSVRSFTTSACAGGVPGADTDPAENITKTSAKLTADVDPNGLRTQAWFAWGSTPSLGQETPHESVGSGTGNVDFSQSLSGLSCDTTYYFENHASNSAGQDDGATLSFTTDACDGGGPPAQGFFLDSRRQGCSGGGPAELLWWTAPAGMDNVFTVRRTDGAYTASVNSSQGGMVHLVSSLLVPGETYSFYVEGTLDGATVQTNVVTVPVISDECRLPVGPGELPHLPLAWAGTPFCSSGTASLPIQWTAVGGAASYTLTRIDNVAGQLTPYPNLTGTSMTDTGLLPGAAYEYMLEAVGSGGARQARRFTVYVPSGICGEPSTPGPFSAQVSAPICSAGKGALTLSWTTAAGKGSKTNIYRADDGVTSGSGSTFTGSSHNIDGIRPGALVKLMVQNEAASTPHQYRSVIMSQRIPLDICDGGTLPPTVTTHAATYFQEGQALLRASIVPNADASTAYFDWGTSANYGSTTPLRNAGEEYRSVSLEEVLSDLECGTTYHYRAVAVNANGRTNGAGQTFTTASCPPAQCSVDVVVSPASGVTWAKSIPQRIRWTGGPGCVHFAFRLLRGGVHDGWIDTASKVTGTEYEWAPEAWLIHGSNVQIEVTGFNAAGQGTSATSSTFNLVNPSVLPSIIFQETGPEMSNWNHEGWASTDTASHSPSFSRTDSQGVYQNNTTNTLSLPRIDLSGRQSAFLTFWHRFELAAGDSANVVAKTDQGNWVLLRTFTGTQPDWRPATIDLSGFLGQPVTLGFQLQSDGSATADGWYIDDALVAENRISGDDFETGDFSRWSSRSSGVVANGNSMEVPSGAFGRCGVGSPNTSRFSRSCGARINVTGSDPTPTYVQDDTPFYEGSYRTRAYVNLRPLQMQNGDSFEIFTAYNGVDPNPPADSGNAVVRLIVQQTSGGKQLIAIARSDAGAEVQSAAHPLPNGWRAIEISWTRSTSPGASNGRLDLWIDGAAKSPLTGLDSDLQVVNYARWGAVAGLDAGTSGTFWLDDFASQRTSYIGPAFPFTDNPTSSSFFPFIQGIYAAEVIPECALGLFCPENWITRKEMAKFILLAKFGANFTPPACTTPLFSDVPCSHPYATWINEMANQGISAGCGSGRFCPDGNVSRDQMAVFLMVAVGATPTPCPPSVFSDVPASSSFCPWIKEIATRGITSGCGGGNFCPSNLVSRGQMAVFLTTTFNLPRHVLGP